MTKSDKFKNATLVWANIRQFAPGEIIRQKEQRSVLMLWPLSGKGAIEVNQQRLPIKRNHFYVLPWNRSLNYFADENRPYNLGCIHVIPDHSRAHPVRPFLRPALLSKRCRSSRNNVAMLPDDAYLEGHFSSIPALLSLAAYITHNWGNNAFDEEELRSLGKLLYREWTGYIERPGSQQKPLPTELDQIVRWVDEYYYQPISLKDIVVQFGLSASTINRLFNTHFEMTPVTWVRQRKVHHAQELLSTTTLSVAEVGEQVGVPDPYYFSRLFKEVSGMTPSEYKIRAKEI